MSPEQFRRIEELYHAASEGTPQERAALLAQTDPELRREVESLLSDSSGAEFLDRPAIQNAAELLEDATVVTGLLHSTAAQLAAGVQLGPYKIEAPIGAGGMGHVYRARDTRLGRDVAVKVSTERFSDRFEREARAVAALNHPNICTLHDVGPDYLVMELVEGVTLAERIKHGAIPLEDALAIARQIADALEAAHEKGIVHRDLKPGNIKIKPDGSVKVLDFGLAKMPEPERAGDSANSPTLTLQTGTRSGTIMGTAGYMAPEQAMGKTVDKRADIFAFGVVLYEMLQGKRLFKGETVSDTLSKVLTQEPDLRAIPVKVQRLLGRCLEKDPKKRLRDIGDVWQLLEEKPISKPGRRSWLLGAVATLSLALATAFGFLWLRAPAVPSTQFLVQAPGDTQFTNVHAGTAVSPDGRYLVFGAGTQGTAPLWLRPLDSLSARPLPGTEGANLPFWSPDSKSVAFYAGGKLMRSDIVGGAPQVLCDANLSVPGAGGTWNRDGVILFGSTVGLFRVPAAGGVPQQVTQWDTARKELGHGPPQFLPDGKRFLYFVQSSEPNTQGIYAGSLDNPKERVLIKATGRKAYYAPPREGRTGFLLWLRQQTLMAQGFDLAKLRLEGDPTPVAENVAPGSTSTRVRAAFWTSDAGVLVYRTGVAFEKGTLLWMRRDGTRLGEAGKEDRYASIRLSADDKRVAMSLHDDRGIPDIWVWEFGREVMTRITFDPKSDGVPVWSPDGRHIAYYSDRSGVRQFYRKEAGGGGQEEQLTNSPYFKVASDWSRDGRYLLYYEVDPKTGFDIWALPLEGERKPAVVLQTPFSEANAQFSPDGKWIAYNSDASGRDEVYVRAFPFSSGQWQVSNQGGSRPKWRADGKELFYVGPNASHILAAGVRVAGASFQSDTPRELFPISPVPDNLASPFDVTADGQRFLVVQQSAGAQVAAPLTVVTNWQAGLKK
jgi:Tol biopolymer transport system component